MGQAPAASLVDQAKEHCCCESLEFPCHAAASVGDIATLKKLLERRASCSTMDSSGSTPLHVAAEKGHVRVLELLLKSRANVDAQDICGERPIHKAVLLGKVENVRVLIAHNADLQAKDVDGMTATHAAASAGSLNDTMLRVLVKGRVDLLAQNSNKETPIDRAVANGHMKLAQWLAHAATHVPEQEQIRAEVTRSLPQGIDGIPAITPQEDELDQKLFLDHDSESERSSQGRPWDSPPLSSRTPLDSPLVSSRRHVDSPPLSSRRHLDSPPHSSRGVRPNFYEFELGEEVGHTLHLSRELSGLGRDLAEEMESEEDSEEW